MISKERKPIYWGLAASLFGLGLGYYLKWGDFFGQCGAGVYSSFCYNIFSRVGDPLFYGMEALAVVFAILFLFPNAFHAWKKFAIWAVPVIAVFFALYTGPASGDLFSPGTEVVQRYISKLFVLVSIAIIVIADHRIHHKKKNRR